MQMWLCILEASAPLAPPNGQSHDGSRGENNHLLDHIAGLGLAVVSQAYVGAPKPTKKYIVRSRFPDHLAEKAVGNSGPSSDLRGHTTT